MSDLMDYVQDSALLLLTGFLFTPLVCALTTIIVVLFTTTLLGYIKFKSTLEQKKRETYIDGYVHCMVDTYFYGYLRKIIPDDGIGGLDDKIATYKERQNLTDKDFPYHKIFIVIPASGFIPATLESIDKQRISARTNLDPLVLNRAGTSNRIYSTAVYKVKHRNLVDHITVAMEGAPPLLTLFDSAKESKDPGFRKDKEKMVHMFYKKLKQKLAENAEFANSYDLIYYKDDRDLPPTLAEVIIHKHIDINHKSTET